MTHPTDGPGRGEHTAHPAGSVGVPGVSGSPAGVDVGESGHAAVDAVVGSGPPDGDVDRAVGLLRLRLDIAYDGTDFSGWAIQPGRRTVAGDLSEALAVLFRHPVTLTVAGRTDAGVHAVGQVAHIDVDPQALVGLARRTTAGDTDAAPIARGAAGLLRRLAGLLADDVRVRGVSVAPPGFDARFGALRRHYRYRIAATGYGADPLRRRDTLAWSRPLDIGRMASAARTLLGLHDFAAYCKPPAHDGATTIRELQSLSVRELPDEPGVVVVDVAADAFCHSMVRSLVGALLAVGDGRAPEERPRELLLARTRTSAVHGAPARGLTLVRVDYPDADELARRAALTRAVRGAADLGAGGGTDTQDGPGTAAG